MRYLQLYVLAPIVLLGLVACDLDFSSGRNIECRTIAVATDSKQSVYLWDGRTLRRFTPALDRTIDDFRPYDADDDRDGFTPTFSVLRPGLIARPINFSGGIDLIYVRGADYVIKRYRRYSDNGVTLARSPSADDLEQCGGCIPAERRRRNGIIDADALTGSGESQAMTIDAEDHFNRIRLNESGTLAVARREGLSVKFLMGLTSEFSTLVSGPHVAYLPSFDNREQAHIMIYDFTRNARVMLAGARTKLPPEDRIGGLAVDANDNLFVLDNGRRKRILVFERGQAGNTPPSRIIDLPTLQNRILETIALSDSGKTAYIVTDKTAEPTSREGNVAQIHALRLSDRVGVVSRSRSIPLYCNDDSISL